MDTTPPLPSPDPSSAPAPERAPAASFEVRPVDLRDYVDFDGPEARRVRVFATDVMTTDLWCLEPRETSGVLQYADSDLVYTVIGGTAWFVTDEGEIGLDPLGAILIPAGTAHGLDNRSADPVIVQANASPPDGPLDDLREDTPTSASGTAVRVAPTPSGPVRAFRRLISGR